MRQIGVEVPKGVDYNVGKAWDAVAGTGTAAGKAVTFEEALVRMKMIQAIYRSNESGKRESYLWEAGERDCHSFLNRLRGFVINSIKYERLPRHAVPKMVGRDDTGLA